MIHFQSHNLLVKFFELQISLFSFLWSLKNVRLSFFDWIFMEISKKIVQNGLFLSVLFIASGRISFFNNLLMKKPKVALIFIISFYIITLSNRMFFLLLKAHWLAHYFKKDQVLKEYLVYIIASWNYKMSQKRTEI